MHRPGMPLGRAAQLQRDRGRLEPPAQGDDSGLGALFGTLNQKLGLLKSQATRWAPFGPTAPPKQLDAPFAKKSDRPWEVDLEQQGSEDEAASVAPTVEGDPPSAPEAWTSARRRRGAKRTAPQPSAPGEGEEQRPRRLGRSVYDAMETHGHFGLVDSGDRPSSGVSRVILHVPKRSRGYALDVRQGDIIYANSAKGQQVSGRLEVAYVTRYKYSPPGHAVTSCVIGVPEHQWERFRE